MRSQRDMEEMADDFITQGYRVVSQGERSTMLKLRTWGTAGGHAIILILLGWWTLGFFNLCYAVFARLTADKVLVRVDGDEEDEEDSRPSRRSARW